MDLLRSTLKAIYYDFPLEEVARYLSDRSCKDQNSFYDIVKELLTWREKGFSMSEISLLQSILKEEWLVDDERGFEKDAPIHPYERLPLILEKCARELLNIDSSTPRVRIRHLLRWRDLSLLIGEDTLLLPLLAKVDVIRRRERKAFVWPNILGHDDLQLNSILKETLSDTHFHLNAGCDVFEFNWIIAMNHPECLSELPEDDGRNGPDFLDIGRRHDYDKVRHYSSINLNLRNWIIIAAYYRAVLVHLVHEEGFPIEEEEELLTEAFDPHIIGDVKARIDSLIGRILSKALKTSNGIIFDYAIYGKNVEQVPDAELSNVYMVHHGERSFMYHFYRYYCGHNETFRKYSPYLYLYILIKNKIRRELIQTNDLRGFENFKFYQDFKTYFFNRGEENAKALKELAYRYAVQTAIGESSAHFVEARIAPGEIKKYRELDYRKSIFGDRTVIDDEDDDRVTLLCHFIKKSEEEKKSKFPLPEKKLRHETFRKELGKLVNKNVRPALELNTTSGVHPKLVGVDAAGNELICRPELFAPIYKSLRNLGMCNFTYHVGEDFYDIVDGLRAIDEAIQFLKLSAGSRIGHAIALGTDAAEYYQSRHRYIIIPKQVLLDNVVWMKYTAMENNITLNPQTLFFITDTYHKLVGKLKYREADTDSDSHYWNSMKLREADPLDDRFCAQLKEEVSKDPSYKWLDTYWFSTETQRLGRESMSTRLPEPFVEDVVKIQECMYRKIVENGIFIETNPTSNFMIGGFKEYIDLPLFKFHSIGPEGHKLPVSINTDDKGVFATSLKNEFSLVAMALRKEKDKEGNRVWNDKQIIDYLKQIAHYGNISRFTLDGY